MRKLIALLLALMMLCCAAMAENAKEMMALEFADFILAIRKDAVGAGADTIENGVPFLTVYQDYNPQAAFNKGMNIIWNEEVLDLSIVDPAAYVEETLYYNLQQYNALGLKAENVRIYEAQIDSLDDKPVLSYIYGMDLDYSGLGIDFQATIYTLQACAPIEGKGTYTFTITTDDLMNTQELLDVVDSVRWKE